MSELHNAYITRRGADGAGFVVVADLGFFPFV